MNVFFSFLFFLRASLSDEVRNEHLSLGLTTEVCIFSFPRTVCLNLNYDCRQVLARNYGYWLEYMYSKLSKGKVMEMKITLIKKKHSELR